MMLTLKELKKIRKYPNFVKLNLSSRNLKYVDNIMLFPTIQVLNLSFNELDDLSVIECLPFLQELYVQHNKLTKVPVLRLVNLKILDCRYNFIEEVPLKRPSSSLPLIIEYHPQKDFGKDKSENLLRAFEILESLSKVEKEQIKDYLINA
eukprot:NODE_474_length_7000_cov_1.160122.p6 type:complete len:150 gc:universal NODE_474_length_7000_cov_1.160122:1399-1848(+)